MQVVDLGKQTAAIREQAAALLVHEFDEPRGWPTLELAVEEVASVLRDGFAFGVLKRKALVGWVGGLPEYSGRVWELHPMVVRRSHRQRGIGRALAAAFETEARKRGGLTATLGTDDESGMTSLANIDLYDDVPRHVARLRDLGRRHPFLFYRKLGYVVTGVMPDANGNGRPDIYMSKTLQPSAGKRKHRSKAAKPALLSGGNPQIAKADGDAPVQAYIAAMPGWRRDVGRRLDALIVRTVPGVRKAVKWNSPFYGMEGKGWFVSFHTFTNYVKVTFFQGTSLRPAPTGGKAKDARWIDIHKDDLDNLDEAQMAKWIRQAAALPGWGKS